MEVIKPVIAGLMSVFMLCGCTGVNDKGSPASSISSVSEVTEVPEFSDEYLVGAFFGGGGWGEKYGSLAAKLIICTNKEVKVLLPEMEDNHFTEYVQVETFTLTDEQYNAIEKTIDRSKLYVLDPEEDEDVCDGNTYMLILYDKNQESVKVCGGYMPQNEDFCAMYRAVQENIPADEIEKLRSDWIDELRERDKQETT